MKVLWLFLVLDCSCASVGGQWRQRMMMKMLQNSFKSLSLVKKRAKQVIQAIKEAISKLPLSFTDEERQEEREFGSSTKGKKAKHGQKNPMAKSPTHTPPPMPSTSKQSGIQKGNSGPIQNIRSQRQRKPSKKLRDADYG